MNDPNIRCIKCDFFDTYNNFCRCNPPQVIYSGKETNHNTNYVVTFGTAMFPVIRKPELDWCGKFQEIID